MQVEAKPADLGDSGWHAILPSREPQTELQQDIDCDYVVVGAGFAGLMAARRLRQLDAGASIAIVEAHQVGSGPAGRNSGFMIDLPHGLGGGGYAGDDSTDRRNIRMNRAAIAFAEDCARQYAFADAAFAPSGKINAAAGTGGKAHNEAYARHLQALDEPFELLDAGAMRDVCGSDYYCGGLRTPGTAMIQPALFVRSLADALCQHEQCSLYENTPVQSLGRSGEYWLLRCARGSMRAQRVILAVNGLIESFGFYRRRLLHINLYASMTRALSSAEAASLGGESEWGFTPSDPMGSTLRRIDSSSGPRLVIRNGCSYDPRLIPPAGRMPAIAAEHLRTFYARFPMLAAVDMEYRWSGRLCLSRNEVWALGELEPGLFSACCQNGLGTTRGTIAGIVAAEMASGNGAQSLVPDYRVEALPQRLLVEPFMTLGARAVIRFREWRAGREL